MFSTGTLFPLEVIKINLQAHVKDRTLANHTSDEESKEGLTNKPADAAVAGEGLRDRLNNHSGKEQKEEKGEQERGKRSSFVGQKEEDPSPSIGSVAREIYSREGARGFYKGVCYASCQSGVEKAAYFYGYGWLKKLALRIGGGRELNTTTDLVLGYLAEALHLPLTIPIEVRKTTRVQTCDVLSLPKDNHKLDVGVKDWLSFCSVKSFIKSRH